MRDQWRVKHRHRHSLVKMSPTMAPSGCPQRVKSARCDLARWPQADRLVAIGFHIDHESCFTGIDLRSSRGRSKSHLV
jgi:hypothetical protein